MRGLDSGDLAESGAAPSLRDAGDGLYLEARRGGTRLWGRALSADGAGLADLGTVPADLTAAAVLGDRKTIFGLTDSGFVEWDLERKRFRQFTVDGLGQAATGRPTIDISPDGRSVLIAAGTDFFLAELGSASREAESQETQTRLWSEENPMFIKDNVLHIGDSFSFPVAPSYEKPSPEAWYSRAWRWITRRPALQPKLAPATVAGANLPSNKKALPRLRASRLGRTSSYRRNRGGKIWMASMIASLSARSLHGVVHRVHEEPGLLYRNFRRGARARRARPETTSGSMTKRGDFLLDEMHKPLEGTRPLTTYCRISNIILAAATSPGTFVAFP